MLHIAQKVSKLVFKPKFLWLQRFSLATMLSL